MKPGIIILAAGNSSRLGSPKQLLSYKGKALLRHACDTALKTSFRPIVAVLSEAKFASETTGVETALNPNWQDGMGTSIAAGLRRIRGEIDRVILMLCDQPLVTSDFLRQLASGDAPIFAARYNGTLGVPACFDASFFNELMQLRRGAKEIILRNEKIVRALDCPEAGFDVDTLEDLNRLRLAEIEQSAQAQQ